MYEEVRTVSFKVEGDYITELALEKVNEGNIGSAISILKSCMVNDTLSENENTNMIFAILDGRARLVGTYPDDDYGFEYLDEPDESLADKLDEKLQSIKQLKDELEIMTDKLKFIQHELTDHKVQDLNNLYKTYINDEDDLFPDMKTYRYEPKCNPAMLKALDSFTTRMLDKKEHKTTDYGWLEPNGTFHEVDWAQHQEWADDYCKKLLPRETYRMYEGHCGDYLVNNLNWILLHSPMQGLARTTTSDTHQMTKAQKEFLFDYYTDRNLNDKAMELYNEQE